jgi:hypothetical protein
MSADPPPPTTPREIPLEEADLDLLLVGPPPPLGERLRAVFLDPLEGWTRHDAGWGWVVPWLIAAGVGVLYGLLVLARVDLGARGAAEFERAMEQMPAKQRKELESRPELKDMLETSRKMTAFMRKVSLVLGPPLRGLIEVVVFGGATWLAALLLGPKGAAPDALRGISLAAWVGLAELPGYAVRALAVLIGNPDPATSPIHLVDPLESPVLATLLGRLDVVLLYWYLLLGLGLIGSFRLAPRRAWLVVGGLYAAIGGQEVGMALLAKLGQALGGAA